MTEELKAFEFAELPQSADNPSGAPRKRGRRRGTIPKVVRSKPPKPDDLIEPHADGRPGRSSSPNARRKLVLQVIAAMQALEQTDARYVASLFV